MPRYSARKASRVEAFDLRIWRIQNEWKENAFSPPSAKTDRMQTHAKQLLRTMPSFLPTLQTRVRFTPVASHTVSVVNRLFKSQENYVGGYRQLVQESWTN